MGKAGPPWPAALLVSPVLFSLSVWARKAVSGETWEHPALPTLAAVKARLHRPQSQSIINLQPEPRFVFGSFSGVSSLEQQNVLCPGRKQTRLSHIRVASTSHPLSLPEAGACRVSWGKKAA